MIDSEGQKLDNNLERFLSEFNGYSSNSLSILLYHYEQLTECISEVERIENRVDSRKKVWLIKKKEEEEEEEMPTTLDAYFVKAATLS